jgi:alpha-beta hydrolase superfamily lysophospholipase
MSVGTVQERQLRHLEIAKWNEPVGVKPRGTLFVLTGRGENPDVYSRFATRISADAYRVVVISAADYTTPGARSAIDGLINSTDVAEPRVLVGSDVGARAALELAASRTLNIDAVICAGLAIAGATAIGDRDAEIEARTACPVHRGVLGRTTPGTLATAVGSIALRRPAPTGIDVPVLAIHGAIDAISPLEPTIGFYRDSGVAEVTVVDGGRHDILNDVTHRSVAAVIVLFLERLRGGADQAPLLVSRRTNPQPVTT